MLVFQSVSQDYCHEKPSSSSWCEAGGQAAAGGMPETECTAEVVDIIVIIAIITITKLTIG